MGIESDIAGDWHAALAALSWQVDLGVSDVIAEAPVNRYDLTDPVKPTATALPARTRAGQPPLARAVTEGPPSADVAIAAARQAAEAAPTLDALREALAAFQHCDLKRGARNLVFCDGPASARVLILGDAPGVEEDREGRPFVGRTGDLLDRMFAAIGLSRSSPDPATALHITTVLPWRPPQDRDPSSEEIAMMRPFVQRHIALVNPDVIVLLGNTALQSILNTTGIARARGQWAQALDRPVLPMLAPAHLLRTPAAKREAWADLLSLQAKLRG